MARAYYINGAGMVYVKGAAGTAIASLSELGLPSDQITYSFEIPEKPISPDVWGGIVPNEVQRFGMAVNININFLHWDDTIMDACVLESQGGTAAGAAAAGQNASAGARLGNGAARFAATNHFIGLNISAPVNGKPFRFLTAYLTGNPKTLPVGAEKSMLATTWRAIPYAADPWNGGLGLSGVYTYDHVLDS